LGDDGGFFTHLFLYNINRFELRQLLPILTLFSAHSLYFLAAGFGVAGRLQRIRQALQGANGRAAFGDRLCAAPAAAGAMLLLGYLAASTLMLPLMAKSGSNWNYLIEFICVASLFVAFALKDAVSLALGGKPGAAAKPALAIFLAAGVAAQASMLPTNRFDELSPRAPESELAELSRLIRSADKPVISDDMVLLIRSGREVLWEAAIFAELASIGKYDERPFLRMIDRGEFAFFATFRQRGEPTFDSRYNPAVADAIDRAYPVKRTLAGLTLHLPARCRSVQATPPCP
jgi:hypothetical protein